MFLKAISHSIDEYTSFWLTTLEICTETADMPTAKKKLLYNKLSRVSCCLYVVFVIICVTKTRPFGVTGGLIFISSSGSCEPSTLSYRLLQSAKLCSTQFSDAFSVCSWI